MSPRRPDPEMALRLLEVAARLLAEEGESAVSARRVASEAGASTMAVYTHFGSMDELVGAVCREGFRRFAVELDRPADTTDTVADFMTQGWGYRHFALRDRHLYRVMFDRSRQLPTRSEADDAAASGTFLSLLRHIERCATAGRWQVDDLWTAGDVAWSTVHGHALIEQAGYYDQLGRDPTVSYGECLLRLSIGFGDDAGAARASLAAARRRARRAGQSA